MKEKMNEKLDQIGFIMLNIIIVLVSIFIGSSIKNPIYIIQVIVTMFTAIYLIIKKVLGQKQVIIKGKIDIFVLMLIASTFVPLIAKTFASMSDSYEFILKYVSIYSVYILARNLINSKRLSILINTIIITSFFPIIFGIDKMTFDFCGDLLKKIEAVNVKSDRFVSTFGYPNTLAIYLSITMFLAIAKCKISEKKWLKILYVFYVVISGICIFLTRSKAVIFLLLCILGVLIIKQIIAKKITLKMILFMVCIGLVFINYFLIAIQIPKDLEVTGEERTCVIKQIEKNKIYDFTFSIEAQANDSYPTFEIEIVEINRYLNDIVLGSISFADFEGNKTITVTTSDSASYIEIRFRNKLEKKMIINKLLINNEEYILEYKYIKYGLVDMIKDFNFKYPSVWQRGDFYKDGIKILKDNWLFGAGGNSWRNLYNQYQEYLYGAQEAHCYPMEIWISFGLLGIVSYLLIVISCVFKIYKIFIKKNTEKDYFYYVAIAIGTLLLLIHSLMDFDLSFLIMQMLFFIMISVLHEEDKIEIENKNKIDIFVNIVEFAIIILIIVAGIENFKIFCTNHFVKDITYTLQSNANPLKEEFIKSRIDYLEINSNDNEYVINEVKKYLYREPYRNQNQMYEIILRFIVEDINSENIDTRIEDIEFVIKTMKNKGRSHKYNIVEIKDRANCMIDFARKMNEKSAELNSEKLKEISKEFYQMIIDEYPENLQIMSDYERNGVSKGIVNLKLNSYEILYDEAVKEYQEIGE